MRDDIIGTWNGRTLTLHDVIDLLRKEGFNAKIKNYKGIKCYGVYMGKPLVPKIPHSKFEELMTAIATMGVKKIQELNEK
jgi:hypothetical protein